MPDEEPPRSVDLVAAARGWPWALAASADVLDQQSMARVDLVARRELVEALVEWQWVPPLWRVPSRERPLATRLALAGATRRRAPGDAWALLVRFGLDWRFPWTHRAADRDAVRALTASRRTASGQAAEHSGPRPDE
jgi:hypothetical protein